jgi:hypothetical protein
MTSCEASVTHAGSESSLGELAVPREQLQPRLGSIDVTAVSRDGNSYASVQEANHV